MENNLDEPTNSPVAGLSFDQQSFSFLEETRKWGMFLAIMGFIGIGLIVILAIVMAVFMNNLGNQMGSPIPMGLISVLYFGIAIINLFPVIYLYRFASHMKVALYEVNQDKLNTSFENLKSFFKFIGIFTIIILAIYAVVLIGVVVTAMMAR